MEKKKEEKVEKVEKVKDVKKSTSSFKGLIEGYKSKVFPQKEEDVRISMDGKLCVLIDGVYKYIEISKNVSTIKEIMPEMCLDIPVYSIGVPFSKIKENQLVKINGNFCFVRMTERDFLRLQYTNLNGEIGEYKAAKDLFSNEPFIRVIISPFSGGKINPLLMMSMFGDNDFSIKDLMMMQMFNGKNNSVNPFMFMMMEDHKDDSLSPLLMMQAMSGTGGDGNDMMQSLMLMEMMKKKK